MEGVTMKRIPFGGLKHSTDVHTDTQRPKVTMKESPSGD